jgi:hypothetical protein
MKLRKLPFDISLSFAFVIVLIGPHAFTLTIALQALTAALLVNIFLRSS